MSSLPAPRKKYKHRKEQTPKKYLLMQAMPGNWAKKASCRDATALFFSIKDEDIELAKSICAECPVVKSECGVFALTTAQRYGVWAGESLDMDRQARVKLTKAAKAEGIIV